jgi:hypothetical protein
MLASAAPFTSCEARRSASLAAGERTEIELKARVEPVDAGYQIEAVVFMMRRGFGGTWSRRR